jgi:hypothetical protein
MSWIRGPTDTQEYFHHRPYCVDNAIGYVSTLNIPYLSSRVDLMNNFKSFFESNEVTKAFGDYELSWLRDRSRTASRFPCWHEVEGRLNYLISAEILPDYTNAKVNHWKETVGWQQLDHVCAFILRLQLFRLVQEVRQGLKPWSRADQWAAAYVLCDMLHWMHLKFQERMIIERKSDPALVQQIRDSWIREEDTVAPVIQSQAPSAGVWSRFWSFI